MLKAIEAASILFKDCAHAKGHGEMGAAMLRLSRHRFYGGKRDEEGEVRREGERERGER